MENEQKKYRGQKYKIIKEKTYDIYSFLVHEGDKKELFKASVQTFGSLCEELIAKPILATQFRVYKPETFIEKAWNRLYFEMRKLYKKRYKKSFNLFDLFKEESLESSSLYPWVVIKEILTYNYSHRVINEVLIREELIIFAGRIYKIWTSAKKTELYKRLIMDPVCEKRIEKLEKTILFAIYKNAALKRFPNLSRKDLNLLRKCMSPPLREDFFCVPKLNSYFKKPFYFVEIKSTKNKPHTPSLTSNQREFIREFKNKVGILILWIFLNQNKIEVKWLTPDIR